MSNKPKISFRAVSKGFAEKKIAAYISDSHKDLTPMRRNRLAVSSAIAGITIGTATFVIPGEDFGSLTARIAVLTVGLMIWEKADHRIAKDIHDRANQLEAAHELQGHIESQKDKVLLPDLLPPLLHVIATQKLQYARKSDPVRKFARAGAVSLAMIGSAYFASQVNIADVEKYLHKAFSQPALPANNKKQLHPAQKQRALVAA